MPLRNAQAFKFKPKGLSDAIDGTSAFPGAMSLLQNLVPNPGNDNQFTPRPAAVKASAFAGFNTPLLGTALVVIGDLAWGTIPTSRNPGKDEPFCYNIKTGVFVAISNVTSANCPATPSTSGDWVPPNIVASTSGRLTITHPGYDGVTYFVGWIDISNFSSLTITGNTHSSSLVDTLSSNVLAAGWTVGMSFAASGVPANTYIVSIAANGLSVVLSNASASTLAGTATTVLGGTPAAPIYGAGNVNGNPFSSRPNACGIFNGRTWYGLLNFAVFSDTLSPQQVTNASQALTMGDSTPVTAIAGLPLTSQVAGGIIQSLIVFKGAGNFYQITGDAATNNLAVSVVSGSVGTLAPNSICNTPEGMAFVAPDGVRTLGFGGTLSPPLGRAGSGVHFPFTSAVNPTRICAAYNNNVMRITCQPLNSPGQILSDYWFDFDRRIWSGPHTFPNSLIRAYTGGAANTFIHFAFGVNAALWQSASEPTSSSTYTENGVALQWSFAPTLLPDDEGANARMIVETTIGVQLPSGQQITLLAADETGRQLDLQTIGQASVGGSAWNAFNWGAAVWGSSTTAFRQIAVPWSQPLVCRQMNLTVTGLSNGNTVLGIINLRYQTLGYQMP